MVFPVTHLPADSDEQTLCRLQLQLGFAQQQTQHLQKLTVFGGNVRERHPVNVACQRVQGGHGNPTVSSGLCEIMKKGWMRNERDTKVNYVKKWSFLESGRI